MRNIIPNWNRHGCGQTRLWAGLRGYFFLIPTKIARPTASRRAGRFRYLFLAPSKPKQTLAQFQPAVRRLLLHDVKDVDDKPDAKIQSMAREWIESLGGKFRSAEIQEVMRSFTGTALVRARATVTPCHSFTLAKV